MEDEDAVHKIYIQYMPNEGFEEDWGAVWPFNTRFSQKNLGEALLQLQSEQDEVYLWCDPMCIDQANNVEKLAHRLLECTKPTYLRKEFSCLVGNK